MRKVVAFRENLGADQDVDFARPDALPHLAPGIFATGAVAVDTQHARLRKMVAQRLFDVLCALPQGRQVGLSALGTGVRDASLMPAVVAMEARLGHVQDELRQQRSQLESQPHCRQVRTGA